MPLIVVMIFLVVVVLRQPLPEAHFVDPKIEEEAEEKAAKKAKGVSFEERKDVETAQVGGRCCVFGVDDG
jgi:hypothetical protein